MTDIHFSSDELELSMELLEVDGNDPTSMKWDVAISLKHPSGEFAYSANDIWLDTHMWDEFVFELDTGVQKPARFSDQSELLYLGVERRVSGIVLTVSIQDPLIEKGCLALNAVLHLQLDGAFVSRLRDSFQSFAKFW